MPTSNRYKATLTLTAAAVGFFLSYPFQHSFWGGLVNSGFAAAMVGGVADWYAVTALFRKPLSIPYRTAIIPKNRDRIFKAIVTMVEEEIVTADNIKETLAKVGLAKLLLHYVNQPDAKQRLYAIAGDLSKEATYTLDAAKLSAALDMLLREHQDKVRLAPLAGQALEWSLKNGFADKVIDLALAEMRRLAGEQYVTELIAGMYSSALKAYAARQNQRKLVGWLLENLLNLDPLTVAGMIQSKTVSLLEEMQGRDHLLRQRLRGWAADFADNLQTDSVLTEKAEAVLRPLVVKLAERLGELPASNPEFAMGGVKWVVKQVAKLVEEFAADNQKEARLDEYLTNRLAKWVSHNHGEIGQIVTSYLEKFSNDQLVAYIEDKVMDDLQMIRINGSVVGGLVGVVLFLIAYAAGVRS